MFLYSTFRKGKFTMKKYILVLVSVLAYTNTVLARTPEQACEKYNATAEKQIEKTMNYKTYSENMKNVRVDFIKATAKLKCDYAKNIQQAREEKKAEKARQRAEKKAQKQNKKSA